MYLCIPITEPESDRNQIQHQYTFAIKPILPNNATPVQYMTKNSKISLLANSLREI